MKIKTTSWHYRLLHAYGVSSVKHPNYFGPVSLCRYFWMVVGVLGMTAAISTVAAFMAASMLSAPYVLLTTFTPLPLPAFEDGNAVTVFGLMFILGSALWLAFSVCGLFFLQQEFRIFSRAFDRVLPERETDREPGLLLSWLRAKKEKVCPVIEFEDTK